jgi:hypothetical protein
MRVKVDKVYAGEEILFGYQLAIWEVSLQDFDLTTIHHDLRMIEWYDNQPQGKLRFSMGNPPPDSIHAFKNEFESLKYDILDQLYETGSEYIQQNWYRGLEYYKNNTKMTLNIYKDLPGFSMGSHIDNSHIMFQLLINLTDNDTGTAFHTPSTWLTPKSTDIPVYKGTGEQGKGLIFVNTPNSAHSINDVTKDRYIVYATIGF